MSKAFVRAALVAFVIADIALVVGVIRHVDKRPPVADLPVSKPVTPSASTSAAAGKQQDYRFKPAKASSISMSNDQTLLYATRGQCDGDVNAKLVLSTNGGASTSTPDTGLKEIVAVSAVSRSELHVVGADGDCALQRIVSTDGGDSWTPDSSSDFWYPDLKNSKKVVSPDRTSKPGCIVTSMSQIGDDFARVSCADGTIRGTGNGGAKWLKLGHLDNVRVASFTTFNAGYALAAYQGCAAQQFTTRDGGRTWAPGGCISGEPAQAIGANDTGLVALVANQLYASDNGGKSWAQP
ncbi:hypothetical protein [Aeromicrobium sp. 9AM]|uniref:WD40/YVTN/BNR-like repeat-containing protein n=1 Tax=Aeromicrobium sp. 9AM TaxID=2653126 RepID=UPI0012F433B5|nr:hypothetical protein [Aeromicrobium sp. 9AM]VXB52691.1 conserved hypothetical protein [Aeromicrobium sp. 9AM]